MNVSSNTPAVTRWVIEKDDTQEWLGVYAREADLKTAEFGSRYPLMGGDLRTIRAMWDRYCRVMGYTKRTVTLPKMPPKDAPGPAADLTPAISFRKVVILPDGEVVK